MVDGILDEGMKVGCLRIQTEHFANLGCLGGRCLLRLCANGTECLELGLKL